VTVFDAHLDPVLDGVPGDQVRLLTKVARMYHERGLGQQEIAAQLHLSQPRVSRLLKQAVELGIVRTTVISPPGIHADLEDEIERRYGLSEVVVAHTEGIRDEAGVLPAIASAAAGYLESTLSGDERIGISSWSSSLLATVEAMRPRTVQGGTEVVQILGGVGTSAAQPQATRLTGRLAQMVRAEARYLMAPGLLASIAMRDALITDPSISAVLAEYPKLTVALVGVGSLEPSPLLRESGNAMAVEEMEELRAADAVGDICLRFFDSRGRRVSSDLDRRVLGIETDTLLSIPRRVGVAGGERKWRAIRAAAAGGWVNVLVTDLHTAEYLLASKAADVADGPSLLPA
jgi:DNA-binding transcriptional regulator LsrR (DeoR family)